MSRVELPLDADQPLPLFLTIAIMRMGTQWPGPCPKDVMDRFERELGGRTDLRYFASAASF